MAKKNYQTHLTAVFAGILLLPLAAVHAADNPKAADKVKAADTDKRFPDKHGFFFPRAPYLYDPISKDVGDPTILFNHETGAAWVFYTQRDTMKAEGPGWYHGCDIGMQSSQFGGFSWVYRGTAEGLKLTMKWKREGLS